MKNYKAIILTIIFFLTLTAIISVGIKYKSREHINSLSKNNIIKNNKTNKRLIRINDKLYYDSKEESKVKGRYGVMSGRITSNVDEGTIPTENEQSNFEGEYVYQLSQFGTIDVRIGDKFIVFKALNQSIDFLDYNFKIELVENENKEAIPYYKGGHNQTIYLVNFDEIYLSDSQNKISLKTYIEQDHIEENGIDIAMVYIMSLMDYDTALYDGGTSIYRSTTLTYKLLKPNISNTEFTIINCNNISKDNYDYYIGPKNFDLQKGYCGH